MKSCEIRAIVDARDILLFLAHSLKEVYPRDNYFFLVHGHNPVSQRPKGGNISHEQV